MRPDEVVDWESFLSDNGCSNIIEYDDWIMCDCIFHQQTDTNRPSFGIHKETGIGNCFGCGKKTWEDICAAFDISSTDFIDCIKAKTWDNFRIKILGKQGPLTYKRYKIPSFSGRIQSDDNLGADYFHKRGIDIGTISDFDILYCWDKASRYNECIIFPIYDNKGILFFEARYVGPNEYKSRWLVPKDAPRWKTYFGWQLYCNSESVIFVEGYSDALKLIQLGFNAIAAKTFSPYQLKLLFKSKIENIFTLYDKDEAGDEYSKKVSWLLSNCGRNIIKLNLPDYANDPAELKNANDLYKHNSKFRIYADTF